MKIISIVDNNKTKVIDVIRYFQYQKSKILLFVDSDEERYNMTVKIAKVVDELGFIKLAKIKNKYEWLNTKSLIGLIAKEISKNKVKSIKDLDPKELTGVKLESYNTYDIRLETFKILVDETSNDALESIDETMKNMKPFVPMDYDGKNYKELYEASQKENHSNKEVIKTLMEEIEKYRAKYGELGD